MDAHREVEALHHANHGQLRMHISKVHGGLAHPMQLVAHNKCNGSREIDVRDGDGGGREGGSNDLVALTLCALQALCWSVKESHIQPFLRPAASAL
jgi:hypothetical protein